MDQVEALAREIDLLQCRFDHFDVGQSLEPPARRDVAIHCHHSTIRPNLLREPLGDGAAPCTKLGALIRGLDSKRAQQRDGTGVSDLFQELESGRFLGQRVVEHVPIHHVLIFAQPLVFSHNGVVSWLSDAELHRFITDGYLVVTDVVPEPLLRAADEEIDKLIAEVAPDEGDGGPGTNLWFRPTKELPCCDAALRESPALGIAEELVAPQTLDNAFGHIQVAATVPPYQHIPRGPHLDGHAPHQETPASFTILAGVILTDQTAPQRGNLWVWPSSHLIHQKLFAERGTSALRASSGHPTLLDPPVHYETKGEVRAKRGDLLLAHYLTGHNKGGNAGPDVRRTIYYRLAVPGHRDHWESTFLNLWREYPPIASIRYGLDVSPRT